MPRRRRTAAAGFPPPPSYVSYLGSAVVEGKPAVAHEVRRKRCYELVSHVLAFGDAPDGAIAVHGSIDGGTDTLGRIGHAWLKLPGGFIWEPIAARVYEAKDWAEWAQAEPEVMYGKKDLMVEMLRAGHMGPWHEPHSFRELTGEELEQVRRGSRNPR